MCGRLLEANTSSHISRIAPVAAMHEQVRGVKVKRVLQRFCADSSGQDLIEYGMILALLALGVVLVLARPWDVEQNPPPSLGTSFDHVSTQLGS